MAKYAVEVTVTYRTHLEASGQEEAIRNCPDPPAPGPLWQQAEVGEFEILREGASSHEA